MIKNDGFDEQRSNKLQLSAQDSERILGPIHNHWRGSYPLSPVRLANHGTVFPSNIHEQDICSPCVPHFGQWRLPIHRCSPYTFYQIQLFTPTVWKIQIRYVLVAALGITVMRQLSRLCHAFCHMEPYVSFILLFFLYLLVPWQKCCKNNKF